MTVGFGHSFFTLQSPTVPRHLWTVVSDPTRARRVVIVNVSTKPSPSRGVGDATTAVAKGEHPSVGHPSYIRPEEARLVEPEDLEKLLSAQKLSATRAAPAQFVERLRSVLLAAADTPIEVKDVLRAEGDT